VFVEENAMTKHTFSLAFLCLFIACKGVFDNPDIKQEFNEPLVPLSIENQWTYESDELPGKINCWFDSTFTYTYGDSLIEMFSFRQDMGSWIAKNICYYFDNSYNQTLFWNIEPNNPTFCFKFPVVTREQWTNEYVSFGKILYIDKYTLQSKNEWIDVPAGTFVCHDYKIDRYLDVNDSLYYSMNYYFTPGIGLIAIKRTELDLIDHNRTVEIFERKLLSYDLK
jgi:hypothetical protein